MNYSASESICHPLEYSKTKRKKKWKKKWKKNNFPLKKLQILQQTLAFIPPIYSQMLLTPLKHKEKRERVVGLSVLNFIFSIFSAEGFFFLFLFIYLFVFLEKGEECYHQAWARSYGFWFCSAFCSWDAIWVTSLLFPSCFLFKAKLPLEFSGFYVIFSCYLFVFVFLFRDLVV